MRHMPSSELVSLISFLAVLLIFFSIDIRSRTPGDQWHARLFEYSSRIGGISTAAALTLGWVDMFLPDDSERIHVALVAIPGSLGVLCAIILGVEMLFLRDGRPGSANDS
ncbi:MULTISPECIES: hypothetical protein [unclassified Pseudactinotalea]|uniref:hypothetical protein n=1 Tax=unclassified Pseudactinotalea TaxID=2649176 RepID=UPI00128BFE3D|nr:MULTISPECIES: hypothetical protein [unclassified Pseudactinotalea]MPV48967.1 hypothetical protein [Pseudactinotalea sp. HY160]QGH68357.1 hypothetical protein GCE65_01645 [Pseudactinotalea sp. HY158]